MNSLPFKIQNLIVGFYSASFSKSTVHTLHNHTYIIVPELCTQVEPYFDKVKSHLSTIQSLLPPNTYYKLVYKLR